MFVNIDCLPKLMVSGSIAEVTYKGEKVQAQKCPEIRDRHFSLYAEKTNLM